MAEPISIKESTIKDDSTDLSALKEQGLRRIQELAGNQWTDYNFHDPGVTILEVLCYALTDLAYRADFDISDLLNTDGNTKISDSLFPPGEILTTNALSNMDFRRLILDMEGVKNCSILPSRHQNVIPGIYDVCLEIHPDYEDPTFQEQIRKNVRELLNRNRPLGITFNEIVFMEHEPVGITLDLELTNDIDPKKIFSEFIKCVQNYFSPEIKFRSLQELLEKGVPVESIFNGPLLDNGFLPDEELHNHVIRQQIFVSDLMSLIMAIPGISFVHELKVIGTENQSYNWIYQVPGNKVPRLDPHTTSFICRYKNTIVYESKPQLIELWFSPYLNRTSSHRQNTLDVPNGISRNLKKYHSIQHDFPETYGVGAKGPSAGAPPEKLGAIKQFKGYLTIFDQIMANFLGQLDHIKYLFSTEDIEHSYAVQLIDEIPGVEFLYKQFVENYLVGHSDFTDKIRLRSEWTRFLNDNREKLTRQIRNAHETKDEFLRRRNTVLNHLLARFGVETFKLELLSELSAEDAIGYKMELIRNYPKLSAEKHSSGPSSVQPAISGIHEWIARNLNLRGAYKTGITDAITAQSDSENSANGFKINVCTTGQPLKVLMKEASNKEHLLPTSEDEISVVNDRHEAVSTITLSDSSLQNKKEFVFNKLRQMDHDSENMLIIDHITLRPDDNMPCYGFNVITDNQPFFISERNYTFNECNAFADEFTGVCRQKHKFTIIETSLKEFRIRFQCSHGNLLTRSYYSSRAEAEDRLDYFLESVKDKTPVYTFYTKYEDLYTDLANPFSFIVTVLIPAWPSKFQKEGFKKYMEEYLYEELPSHLVVNIKWLDFEAMKEAEEKLAAYTSEENTGMAHDKLRILDALMSVLIS